MVNKPRRRARYSIFLSHSHRDRWIAKRCADIVRERSGGSIEVLLAEKDIEAGQAIAESIRFSIDQCSEFLVLMTQSSRDRPWVLIEIGAAWGLRKHIVAVVYQVGPNEMPDIISPYKAIDLNDFDEYVEQLVIRAKVGV